MRRVIATRLTAAKNQEVPHYYQQVACVMDNLLDLKDHLNKRGTGSFKLTLNDFIIKAVARANLLVPQVNSHWYSEGIRQYHSVDVSVAVATPTGLITPIVFDAHAKGLVAISNEVKELSDKAKKGALKPSEYQGGTVTVSNLGAMGIDMFTAIINPPQSMILAVGTTMPRIQINKNAETNKYEMTNKIENIIKFTASFDHRVIGRCCWRRMV